MTEYWEVRRDEAMRGGSWTCSKHSELGFSPPVLLPGPTRPRLSERSRSERKHWFGDGWKHAWSGFSPSHVARSCPISLTLTQHQHNWWKVEPCIWISIHRKKSGLPDREKLHVISRYWGVLHRVSELLFLSEYWLPTCKMKQLVSTSLFTKFLEALPQS